MGCLSLACLVLVLVIQVKSYTLRDALRDRELNRLRYYDTRQSNRQFSDEELFRVLNRLRDFHQRQLFDEIQGNEGCKNEHPDCDVMDENMCEEEKDEHIKEFVEKHCRKACNVNNCNPDAGNIKPPSQQKPTCTDDLPNYECKSFVEMCNVGGAIGGYLFKYCSRSCSGRSSYQC